MPTDPMSAAQAGLPLVTNFLNLFQRRSAIDDAAVQLENGARGAGDIFGVHASEANQTIDARALEAIARMLGVTEDVAAQLLSTSGAGAGRIEGATQRGVQGINTATANANAGLNPYAQGGADAFTRLSDLVTKGPGPVNIEEDPGYQFRLAEGAKALERSAAARGGALGGAAMKAMARYSQGVASQEYQNAWNRSRADFDMQTKGLTSLSDIGFNASALQGRNTMTGGLAAADLDLTGTREAEGLRMRGVEGAGSARIRGAEYAGNMDWNRGVAVSNNLMDVGLYKGERAYDIGKIRSARHMAKSDAWTGFLNNLGRTDLSAFKSAKPTAGN
jgi:hypothetical protein